MRMRTFYLILVLHTSGMAMYAQATISGTVVDTDGRAIDFANVYVRGTELGVYTDAEGQYELVLPELSGGVALEYSALGYETVAVSIDRAVDTTLVITLAQYASALDEVVVSGTLTEVRKSDSPVAIDVYREAFFKANPTPSVFEALQNVNGVRPQLNCSICNTGDIHINGLEGAYTMVLLDGMPIVSGLSTVYGLTGIPMSLIERVEIVKGPASTLYGSEAVAGLINIITKSPAEAARISLDANATTWGEVNVDLGGRLDLGQAKGLLGINYFTYQNPIDHNGDGMTDVTLQDRVSVFNKWQWQRKDHKTTSLAARYLYEDRWGGQLSWTPADRGGDEVYGESIYTSRVEVMGQYDLPGKEDIRLQLSANSHYQNSVYGDISYIAEQHIAFLQATWRRTLGHHNLLLGSAMRFTAYDDNTPATSIIDEPTGEIIANRFSNTWLPGLFVQDEIALDARNTLLAGLRYDYNTVHGSILSPRLNYRWSSRGGDHTVRLGIGNGYRVANVFTEDHAALTGAREVVFEQALTPETSWAANLNYVWQYYPSSTTAVSVDATAFYTYFDNRIIADYDTNPNQIRYANLDGHSVSRGLSLQVTANTTGGFTANVGATLLDNYFTEEGEAVRPVLTETFMGVWTLSYRLPRTRLTLDYTGQVYAPMRLPLLGELDPRPEYSPWFSLQNVQLTYAPTTRLQLYGGLKNLLDYTPPANSIARAFDPFDRGVTFDADGQAVATPGNPEALTFDPTYVFAPNQGLRGFVGLRWRM